MNPAFMGTAQDSGIVPATLNFPLFNQQGDQLDYSQYDRLLLANSGGAIARNFFEIGLGQTDPISSRRKTLADTNLRTGQIPEGQAFAMFIIKFYLEFNANFSEANYLSFVQWLKETTIQINIDTKQDYGTWKLSELVGIPSNGLIVPAAAGSNVGLLSVGTFQGLKPLNLYLPFPRLVSWVFTMNQGAAPASALDNLGVVCSMVGIKNRAG